jgi:pimeloyl-ACP methyl ester carboxylesterase
VAGALLSRSAAARARSRSESLGHEARLAALGKIATLYPTGDDAGDEEFYAAPASVEPTAVHVRDIAPHHGDGGGEVCDLRWPSDYHPWSKDVSERYLSHALNRTAVARVFLHRQPRPAVMLVHGYRTGQLALEERVLPARWFWERGLDVAVFVLPFHGRRAQLGSALFPSTDPRITNEGFRQAVFDLRALGGWLRRRGSPGVGALGMSLGGYTVSLLGTVEEQLSFLVPVIPLASLADAARDGQRYVGTAAEQALQHAALEAAHRAVSPLARRPRVDPERVMIIAGDGDRITPMAHAERLAAHFRARLERFPGGHLLQFGRSAAYRAMIPLVDRAMTELGQR